MEYVELHNHTHFSFGDCATSVPELAEYCESKEIPAVAVTDHGNCLAWTRMALVFPKHGIKPIYGMEAYTTPTIDNRNNDYGHITLIAHNNEGMKSIYRLSRIGNEEGFYRRPRIDAKALADNNEGLICLSGCLSNLASQRFAAQHKKSALNILSEMNEIFGEKLYCEFQFNELQQQREWNRWVIDAARHLKRRVVLTSDSHYLTTDDRTYHDILRLMTMGGTIDEAKEKCYGCRNLNLKRYDDVVEAWKQWGLDVNPFEFAEGVESTSIIANMCDAEVPLGEMIEPTFDTQGEEQEDYFSKQIAAALADQLQYVDESLHSGYIERTKQELHVITSKRLVNYFLVISDMVRYSRERGIPVNARGSVSGSLISFLLGISSVDPIELDLSFDRFLTMDRADAPDIDIDFSDTERIKVIEYMMEKYGGRNVYPVISMVKFNFRSLIRRLSKVFKIDPDEVSEALAESYEDDKRKDVKDLADLLSEDIRGFLEEHPEIRVIGNHLLGKMSHMSRHAAAIVVTPKEFTEYGPVVRNSDVLHCGWDYDAEHLMLEKVGLLKIDMLGLRTLTEVQTTVDFVEKRHDEKIDIRRIPLDNEEVFHAATRGDTIGTFQFNGRGMRSYLKMLKPTELEHLIALCALFRPACIQTGMIDAYVDRRRNGFDGYTCDEEKQVLGNTYGIIVYQEQTMELGRVLADMTGAEADSFRKAASKLQSSKLGDQTKSLAEIGPLRDKLYEGAQKRGLTVEQCDHIWNQIESFGTYGFNRAHSASYAWLGYVTIWLKVNYPVEFFAGLLVNSDSTKLNQYVSDAIEHEVPVYGPDVKTSQQNWTIVDDSEEEPYLRMGLESLKWVGVKPANHIVANRPYNSLNHFFTTVCGRDCNLRQMKSLISAGAFNSFGFEPEDVWEKYCEFRGEEIELDVTRNEAVNGTYLMEEDQTQSVVDEIMGV